MYAERVIADIDHTSTLVAYTDGAAQGNPGPAGAGAIVTYPHWGGRSLPAHGRSGDLH